MSNDNYDPVDLVGQEVQAEQAKLLQKHERNKEIDDFNWIMSDARGRRFMWRTLAQTGLYRNPFTGNSQTFFNCGQMNIGQWLMAEIHEHCPDAYMQMVNEAKSLTKTT